MLFVVACAPALSNAAEGHDTRPRASDMQLRHALDAIRLQHSVPGLAAALFDRQQVRVFATGELVHEGNPVTPSSRFRLGQTSNLFTGLAVAALDADGSLSADAELRRLAPEVDLHNPWASERPVRVEHLLAHRAGLGPLRYRNVYADSAEQPLLAAINRAYRELRLEFPPGEREQYSLVGPAIAAYLVEKSVSMPYEQVLERLLFKPLELSASLGRPGGELPEDSRGHAGWPPREVPALALNAPPTGDIWMSAGDLGSIGRMLLNRGLHGDRQVIPAEAVDWLESMDEQQALVPGSRRGVHAEEHAGLLFYTQTGALPGFLTRIAYSPELGRGYLVMLNHGNARKALASADALLRGQLLTDARPTTLPATAGEPPPIPTGWYHRADSEPPPRRLYQWWLGLARVTDCEQGLCFRGLGQPPVTLVASGEWRLRERGRWFSGWRVVLTDDSRRLLSSSATWAPTTGLAVAGRLAAVAFVISGLVLALALLPAWTFTLVRGRVTNYHALAPRLVPLAAALTFIAGQVALFMTGYPALAQPGAASISVLVLTLLAPVTALLALAAAIAGFVWGLPARTAWAAVYVALATIVASVMLAMADLVAFQSWNY